MSPLPYNSGEYCLYVRKSRSDAEAEARGEGETLARHTRTLLDLAAARKLGIGHVYKEIVSGETIAARPVMQQLLQDVEQGVWQGVLVMEIERLARGDTIDQGIVAQTFKFSDTKIITPMKDYDPNDEYDEEYFEFSLFMSRREYKTIKRRMQRGRVASAKEGNYVGSRAPYGYKRVKIEDDKGYTLEPIPEEADVVRSIFEYYTGGEQLPDGTHRRLGVSLITRRLNELKIKPQRSEYWSTASVRDILRNPVYIGKIRWNNRPDIKKMVDGRIKRTRPHAAPENVILVNGKHPAIVSEEIYQKAQEFLTENKPHPIPEKNRVQNPLAGLVYCEKCGHAMVRRPYQGDYPDTLLCPATHCDNVSSMLHFVEQHLLDSLRHWVVQYQIEIKKQQEEQKKANPASAQEKALKRLGSELQKLNEQLDHTHDLLEQGVYTPEMFLDRTKKISEKIRQNEAEQETIRTKIIEFKRIDESRMILIPKIERLLEVYDTLPTAKEKNEMLKEVLERVTYRKDKGGRWHNSPEDFILTLYPRIPKSNH